MDASALYLIEALEYVDAIVDLPLSDMFFESDDIVKEQMKVNEEASQGAIAAIKKAFQKIIEAIRGAINNLTDFIKNKFMSKQDKDEYNSVKKAISQDPEFGKQEVEIEDFKVYEEAYDKAIKDLDAEMNKENPDPEKVNGIVDLMTKKIKSLKGVGTDVGKRAAVVVPLKTAVDIADKNVMCAKILSTALNSELIDLEEANKILGEKKVAKYKKKIDRYAKNGIIHRAKAKVLRHKEATLKSVLVSQMNTILNFSNVGNSKKPIVTKGSIIKGAARNPKYAMDIAGGVKGLKEINKEVKPITDTLEDMGRTNSIRSRMIRAQNSKNMRDFKSFIGR